MLLYGARCGSTTSSRHTKQKNDLITTQWQFKWYIYLCAHQKHIFPALRTFARNGDIDMLPHHRQHYDLKHIREINHCFHGDDVAANERSRVEKWWEMKKKPQKHQIFLVHANVVSKVRSPKLYLLKCVTILKSCDKALK